MKQTAVDSFIKSILPFIDRSKVSDMMLQDIVSEHLAMEKEQIMQARMDGINSTLKGYAIGNEEYYNNTYKSE